MPTVRLTAVAGLVIPSTKFRLTAAGGTVAAASGNKFRLTQVGGTSPVGVTLPPAPAKLEPGQQVTIAATPLGLVTNYEWEATQGVILAPSGPTCALIPPAKFEAYTFVLTVYATSSTGVSSASMTCSVYAADARVVGGRWVPVAAAQAPEVLFGDWIISGGEPGSLPADIISGGRPGSLPSEVISGGGPF